MKKKEKLRRRRHQIKPKESIIKKPLFWFSFLFLIAVSTALYFFIFFEKIQITDIKIFGNEKVSVEELKSIVSDKINRKILWKTSKSIFLTRKSKIISEVLNKFPEISEVKIEKGFPNTLILEIKEREPFAIFCSPDTEDSEKCFFLDKNGIIFENITPDSFSSDKRDFLEKKLIIRFSESKKEFSLGQEVVGKELLDSILQIQENLKDTFQIDIQEAVVSLPSTTYNVVQGLPERLDIKTSENWQIYFNLESDINLQITKLNLLLKEEISPEKRENLEYIDVRFSRAYYKYK